MIKAKIGRDNYVLGLSRANCERLLKGQPILVHMKEIGGPDIDVIVMGGETEDSITQELAKVTNPTRDGQHRD